MAAYNGQYAAYLRQNTVYVEDLASPGRKLQCFPSPGVDRHHGIALSTLQPRLLAISNGSHILVFDAFDGKLRTTITGYGRTITALDWSSNPTGWLISGSLDGSLSLWDLKNAGFPLAQLRTDGACVAVSCCPTDVSVYASIHNGKIIISKLIGRALRKLCQLAVENDQLLSIAWHPKETRRLTAATQSGKICLWDLSSFVGEAEVLSGHNSDGSDSEDGIFGNLDDVGDIGQTSLLVQNAGPVTNLHWIDEKCILGLGQQNTNCVTCLWQETAGQAVEIWSQRCKNTAYSVCFHIQDGAPSVAVVSSHGIEKMALPQSVLEIFGFEKVHDAVSDQARTDPLPPGKTQDAPHGMKPLSISTMRASRMSFAKASKQLRLRQPSFERTRKSSELQQAKDFSGKPEPPSPPPPRSMTSSLELSRPKGEGGSPMPFLSPSIPSQQPSPGELPPLDDSVKLPSFPSASFDSSAQSASAAGPESDDSDDETFVEGMQGSASFLPGGINVPLPKACAALFTPTGELLTCFPPRPKVSSPKADQKNENRHDSKTNAKKVARLFPTFGNLAGEPQHWMDNDSDSGFESTSSVSADTGSGGIQPSFTFFPSSFPSQESWKQHISPTKHSFTEQTPHKVIVSLHNIQDVESLLPTTRMLASQYRILCREEETGADLCAGNAKYAEALKLKDVADIWRVMALLLEDRLPLEVMSDRCTGDDILVIARKAEQLTYSEPRDFTSSKQASATFGKLRWSDDPLGAAWIVRAVLDWAERNADIQLLAVLSAVLADAQESQASNFMLQQAFTTRLPSYQIDYFTSPRANNRVRRLTNQSVPILRTDSIATSNAVYESPVKTMRSSTVSSRNQSQPSTPYLETESITPPFSLPNVARQHTRLSISGSASPEHNRSSFSAAAKYYAQSISDKFASYGAYGTSPPARRTGTSPSNTNELSTSFPSGSWGKSVSFASTTNTTKASLLSSSLGTAQQDEGYDSDKTVEDLSLPPTPKDAECAMVLKNEGLFDDDVSGGHKTSLIPDDMVGKCRIWCQYYAEQLRCWGLLLEAAELEKVVAVTCLRPPTPQTPHQDNVDIVPTIVPGGSKACTICSIKMPGGQVFCPACAHSAHLSCLEDFILALSEDDGAFVCPTGCGCRCADLSFEVVEVGSREVQEKPKKASFTDPTRWRARVEGGSSW